MPPIFSDQTSLRLGFALVSVVPAALAALLLHSPASGALAPRQACPPTYFVCSSNIGYAICLAPDEYCCQILGIDPFSCPSTHPYCCPGALCGSDSSCSGPIIDPLTQTGGAPATATATTPIRGGSSSGQTATSGSSGSSGKTGGASSVAMGDARNLASVILAAVSLLVATRMAWL
jgi:hypothetical protein